MSNIFTRLLGLRRERVRPTITLDNGRAITGTGDVRLDGLLVQSLNASLARFHSWHFRPETMMIDPETASREQIIAALQDCHNCNAVEYPETEDGCGRADKRIPELEAALRRRFPETAEQDRREIHKGACRVGGAAHGWSP